MIKEECKFGRYLLELRQQRGLTQWQLALATGFNPTNLRKVEKGKTQPGIIISIKLIKATGADVGIFFADFAQALGISAELPLYDENFFTGFRCNKSDIQNHKILFGLLFRYAREKSKISQKKAAETAEYSLRNIFEIENGKQEPGVVNALMLVSVLKVDISVFFQKFADLISNTSPN